MLMSLSSFSHEMSGDDFIQQLKNTGKLGIFDTASIAVFNNTCSSIESTGNEDDLKHFCEVVVSSPICAAVDDEDKLQCTNMDESRSFDTIDFLAGCTEGLFNSARELLSFLWDAMKWVFNSVTHPVEFAQDAGEFAESASLYLTTEYDRAYDEVSPPFKGAKAIKEMAQSIGSLLMKGISDFLYQEYQEFGCMNFRARTETMCFVAGELIIPPVAALALIKKGPAAFKTVSNGMKQFLNGQRRTLALNKRKSLAEKSLGKTDLPPDQVIKIEEAHLVGTKPDGSMEIDADGINPAGIGNYTLAHIREKARILREAGFSSTEIRSLMSDRVVGVSDNALARLFGRSPSPPKPNRPTLEATGDSNTDRFRESFNSDTVEGDSRFISYVDESTGERLPGKIVENNNGNLVVESIAGVKKEFPSNQLESFRLSSTSRDFFNTPKPLKLDPTGNANVDGFRDSFNSGKFEGDNRFVSVLAPSGDRLPAKVIESTPNRVTVEVQGGRRIDIDGDNLNDVRLSNTAINAFDPPLVLAVKEGGDGSRYYNQFRRAFYNKNVTGDSEYVSFIAPSGDRLPGRVTNIGRSDVTITTPGGVSLKVKGDDLLEIRVSSTARETFSVRSGNSVPGVVVTPAAPRFRLEVSGNRNVDEFRRAFNSRRVEGDNQFVSIPFGPDRRPARVVNVIGDDVALEVLDQTGNIRRVILQADELNNVRVSTSSRDYFNGVNPAASSAQAAPSVGGYNFSSKKLSDYKSTGGDIVEVNLSSPSLQRHMDDAISIIEQRTGIKPNPNLELSAAQRNQIYRVWLDDVVGKVEDQNFGNYANGRQRIIDEGGGKADLGKILDERSAVCRELSMFGHVLLSEYGLRSTVMNGIVGTRSAGGGGHAWIQIFDSKGRPLEILDSNNTRSIHPDAGDYEQAVQGLRIRQTSDLVRP